MSPLVYPLISLWFGSFVFVGFFFCQFVLRNVLFIEVVFLGLTFALLRYQEL